MAANGRLPITDKIINAYYDILRAFRGEMKAVVTSPDVGPQIVSIVLGPRYDLQSRPQVLTEAELSEIKGALSGLVEKGQTISIEQKTDPSIIAGFVVDIGDKHLDLSLATRVKSLENALSAAV